MGEEVEAFDLSIRKKKKRKNKTGGSRPKSRSKKRVSSPATAINPFDTFETSSRNSTPKSNDDPFDNTNPFENNSFTNDPVDDPFSVFSDSPLKKKKKAKPDIDFDAMINQMNEVNTTT